MEVHHHRDLHHVKKPWKEYFTEFLMIFLAVTMGFLAENLREHIVENRNKKVYTHSLAADFTIDTATLHQLIVFTKEKIANIDSLESRIYKTGTRQNDSALYAAIVDLISTFQFDNVNGTYEQIKSSGALRLFDQSLIDSLNRYDATSLKLKLMEDWENKFLYEKVIPQTQSNFNYKVFDDLRARREISHEMYFKNMSADFNATLINQAEVIQRLRERQLNQQEILLGRATGILAELNEE